MRGQRDISFASHLGGGEFNRIADQVGNDLWEMKKVTDQLIKDIRLQSYIRFKLF